MEHEDHVHGFSARRDVVATVWIVGFAALEFCAGVWLSNPAIVADGGHGFMDGFGTAISSVTKRLTRTQSSHRMRVHVPAWVGMCICVIGVGMIAWVAVRQAVGYIPVTTVSAATTCGMGAVGCGLRFRLSRYIAKGGTPLDIFNGQHFASDAETSAVLLICGLFALVWHLTFPAATAVVPDDLFRFAVIPIMIKVVKDNWLRVRSIRRELKRCGCNQRPTG